jgi:hypothetical protein
MAAKKKLVIKKADPDWKFPFLAGGVWNVSSRDLQDNWPSILMPALAVVARVSAVEVNVPRKTFEFEFYGHRHSLPYALADSPQMLVDAQQTLDVLAADEIQEMEAREKIDRKRKALERIDSIDPQLRKDLGL